VAVIKTEAGTPSTQGCRLAFFGVFDGHGGSAVARYAAEQLHGCVMAAGLRQEAERLASAAAAGGAGSLPAANVKQCKAAIAEGFRELDRQVLELCAKEGWQDGCTAVAVWVVGSTCLVANVGDSRCVLARTPQAAPAAAAAAQAASGAVRSPHKLQQRQRTGSNKQQLAGLDTAVQQPAQEPKQSPAPQQQQQKQQPAGEQQEKVEALKAITLTREHKAIFAQERQRIERAGSFVSSDGRLAGE
jgi:serine/threonine protein phosphatase PrpC